ncbi:MAG: hypothetical protein QM786_15955 [Breznakibacter sp.]
MIKILILILSLLLMCCTCRDDENCHNTIISINNSTDTLYITSSGEYPDTSIYNPNPVLDPNFTKVLPNESNTRVLWGRDCIELAFKDLIPYDTLMVYVFDAKVLEENAWETVKENYLVLKRYDLSLEDLQNLNWTITYP